MHEAIKDILTMPLEHIATVDERLSPTMSAPRVALNRLMWQPVASMHPSWWQKLQLAPWQARYQAGTELAVRIEALVVGRYGLASQAQAVPIELTEFDRKLLACVPKLAAIVTVLGLFYLDRPDYLSLRDYRDALSVALSAEQVQQVWNIWPQKPVFAHAPAFSETPVGADIPANAIVAVAQGCAIGLLEQVWRDYPIWRALALTLPAVGSSSALPEPIETAVDIPRWFVRLERLL
jgi:hypothetical protein